MMLAKSFLGGRLAFVLTACTVWHSTDGGRVRYARESTRGAVRMQDVDHAAHMVDPKKLLAVLLFSSAAHNPAAFGIHFPPSWVGQMPSSHGHQGVIQKPTVMHPQQERVSKTVSMSSSRSGEDADQEDPNKKGLSSKFRIPVLAANDHAGLIDRAMEENKVVVVTFVAKWCRTCMAMTPKLQRMSEKFPEIEFYQVEYDKNAKLCRDLGIKSLPYVEVISGKQGRVEGFVCTEGKIATLLASLETAQLQVDQSRLLQGPSLPSEWLPYLTGVDEFGSGKFGKVFVADLTCPGRMPRRIAIKDLQPELNARSLLNKEIAAIRDLGRFLKSNAADREAKIGTTADFSSYCAPLLVEPKISKEGHAYLPMPFCNQGELRDILEIGPTRGFKQWQAIGGQRGMYGILLHVARAVKALHGAGWAHNDLHSGNVLVDCNAEVDGPGGCVGRIIDLGMALPLNEASRGARAYSFSMSPEIVAMGYKAAVISPKSDVWQIGMLMWEVVFGRETLPSRAVPKSQVHLLIPKLDFKNADFPELEEQPVVQELLRGALTQNTDERWDIDQVIEALEKLALPAMLEPCVSTWLDDCQCLWCAEEGCAIELPIGSVVEIVGMKNLPELNGVTGVVEESLSGGLYRVRLSFTVITTPGKRLRVVE